MNEETLQRRLVKLAALRFGDCALNLGRGTGSLTVALADSARGAVVAAVEDAACPPASENSGAQTPRPNVLLFRASPDTLLFADRQFNIVVATLQLQHRNDRRPLSALQEAWRVLLPRGKFVAAYWEGSEDGASGRALAGCYQALRTLICDAGFERLRDDGRLMTSNGIVHCLHARAPRHK